MGPQSLTLPSRPSLRIFAAWLLLLLTCAVASSVAAQTQPIQATTVPLLLPAGLVYDTSGNLYFAETANHVIRRMSPAGALTTVAGTTVQGFAGDGGPATSALLDSPLAVALDNSANLYIADSHNHRIRRIDATTGIIATVTAQADLPSALAFDLAQNLYFADARTHLIRRIDHSTGVVATVAGNGTQGFSGDNGPATLAAIDSPYGIALDATGNLFLSDTHNHRIRRVDAATGIITSIAGTGQPGFSGDNGASAAASFNLPHGLAVDVTGNLYISDARNQRIRRIDSTTGQITTIAGQGTEAFAGDSSPAVSASLDAPRAITISPANLPTLADTANQRIRQVDSATIIHTIAGLGSTTAGTLILTGPAVTLYGTGSLTATLVTSPATGSITFFDTNATTTQNLGTIALAANAAVLSTASLAAGQHRFSATYSGDTLHTAAQSGVLSTTISPAPLTATPNAATILYGQLVPALTGTLSGVLQQDNGLVALALSSAATSISPPAIYPIAASITGASAANYTLTQTSAAITIAKAPSTTALANTLAVHVATTTTGTPTGTVSLYDAGTLNVTSPLSATGDAAFSSANLSTGSHTLMAAYPGDANFLASTSNSTVVTIGAAPAADFTLAATGPTAATVPAGNAASFSFMATPINAALSSPILLTVSGLPFGATASFNPANLPPGNTPTAFTLTIQTAKTTSLLNRTASVLAMLLPLGFLVRRRYRRSILIAAATLLCLGCGDRINTESAATSAVIYNITVVATATSTAGATLQHTAPITLTLQ